VCEIYVALISKQLTKYIDVCASTAAVFIIFLELLLQGVLLFDYF